jgi:hypothetical protein
MSVSRSKESLVRQHTASMALKMAEGTEFDIHHTFKGAFVFDYG